jgi:hypothetical protein
MLTIIYNIKPQLYSGANSSNGSSSVCEDRLIMEDEFRQGVRCSLVALAGRECREETIQGKGRNKGWE